MPPCLVSAGTTGRRREALSSARPGEGLGSAAGQCPAPQSSCGCLWSQPDSAPPSCSTCSASTPQTPRLSPHCAQAGPCPAAGLRLTPPLTCLARLESFGCVGPFSHPCAKASQPQPDPQESVVSGGCMVASASAPVTLHDKESERDFDYVTTSNREME